jgi:hypothetical protein
VLVRYSPSLSERLDTHFPVYSRGNPLLLPLAYAYLYQALEHAEGPLPSD